MERARVSIQRRVDKANRSLASQDTLLIDTRNNGGERWGRGRSATEDVGRAIVVNQDVVAKGADVGVTASSSVEDTRERVGRRVVLVLCRVGWVGVVVLEEVLDGRSLVVGLRVDVGEASTGGKAVCGYFGVDMHVGPAGEVG